MAEMALERGLFIDPSCIWRWIQTYGPELDKRCRGSPEVNQQKLLVG
jgi:hypothetical protein